MEARGFDDSYLWPLPHYQAHSPLRSPDCGEYRLVAHNVVPQAAVEVNRVQDIHLCQKHQVVVTELNCPDGLVEAKATAVPDIVSSEV